ncbi:hypothetical protein GW813_14370 [bacterium]|nr:hypothetical protein [bacterium]PJA76675.1 MAG: hypothetical protein CO151_01830 [bacterium CG_4_9_14_3_um_filter_65_15]
MMDKQIYNRAVKLQWLPILMGNLGLRHTLVMTVWMVIGGMVQGLVFDWAPDRPPGGGLIQIRRQR